MATVCPFQKATSGDESSRESLPVVNPLESDHEKEKSVTSRCPFGYDSHTFKLGPLSCIICQALLFNSSRCVPCSHVFCRVCVSRFKDCPVCGADIDRIEADLDLQLTVDRFIEGHARIKRSHTSESGKGDCDDNVRVIYEDVSLDRGAFLVQQAMRAFRSSNFESAKSRLTICTEDIHDQLQRIGNKPELCSRLGAILGMLGDCCRAMGDSTSAVSYFDESVSFLSKLPTDDVEITHTFSVSLNKIGDIKYCDGDLKMARSYYFKSLSYRRDFIKRNPDELSQIVDVAVSVTKVADVDRAMGEEEVAATGFHEAVALLEPLTFCDSAMEQRRLAVLTFAKGQTI